MSSAVDSIAAKRFDHWLCNTLIKSNADIPIQTIVGVSVNYLRKDQMRAGYQYRNVTVFLFAVFLVFGCASVFDGVKMNKFTDTSKSYGEALAWSRFETANLYRKPELAEKEKPDFEWLRNIKVTQYDIKDLSVSEDSMRVVQEAEIAYYHRDKMIVKTLRDEQVWEFDTKDRHWYLVTRLPEFP